jgi:hypothetical protein
VSGSLPFDQDRLRSLAAAQTGGLTDLGGADADAAFGQLCRRAEQGEIRDIPIEPERRGEAERKLVEVLAGRLRFVADEKRYPTMLDQTVSAPLVVMGIARSGTTLLQALLAADPDHRPLRYWEVGHPSPPPSLSDHAEADIAAETARLRERYEGHPEALAAHPFYDEGGMMLAECEWIWGSRAYLVGMRGEPAHRYGFHRRFLRHLQFGAPPRRWVLKGVTHMFYLPHVAATYPDAAMVWVHRDPVTTIASLLSYTWVGPRPPRAERTEHARGIVDMLARRVTRALSYPQVRRVHHVLYADLVADPVGVVAGIHERAGLGWSAAKEAVVRAWLDDPAHRSDRYGKFDYSLEGFGLTASDIDRRFERYVESFGIPRDPRSASLAVR